jgi:hypothetical protein
MAWPEEADAYRVQAQFKEIYEQHKLIQSMPPSLGPLDESLPPTVRPGKLQ